MNNLVIKKIEKLIFDLCKNRRDFDWESHITLVVKFSRILARKHEADIEICVISALLHDISKLKGINKGHHIIGKDEAEIILKDLNYPKEKIEKVKHCILTHSSDKKYKPRTLEAKIVASADAMSHFYNFNALCYFMYQVKKCSIDDGKKKLLLKYKNSYDKMMPDAKKLVKQRYDAINLLLR